MEQFELLFNKFRTNSRFKSCIPFGSGHINDTFFVESTDKNTPNFILQRINKHVFKNIPALQRNMERVTEHLRSKLEAIPNLDPKRHTLSLIPTLDDNSFCMDSAEEYWRLLYFIDQSISYDKAENAEIAHKTGHAYGEFLNLLSDLPGDPLEETIKDFHNIYFRLDNFSNALEKHPERAKEVQEEINFVQKRIAGITKIEDAGTRGILAKRVTHNDTKINNILFDTKSGNPLAILDLDTVMPGYPHFDFGDAIRTTANNAEEDAKDLLQVYLNIPFFEAFSKGFIQQASFLSKAEIALLPESARFMTFIMGLRFLTDYIEGNPYYKIQYQEQNLVRAKAQFKLVSSIEENLSRMEDYIINLSENSSFNQ